MQILAIELHNIKNCESARYTFTKGTNAICGPNGAGKTTIVEAISWALFDHLAGKKSDFVRRGAKKGTVRILVDFGDSGEYTVIRDTGGTYTIFDPRIKLNIAEGVEDCRAWLTRMMGLSPQTDLASMFTSSIGVPQGAFTYDFNQTPARRKQTFDAILKVEEYRSAADKLLEAVNHVRDRLQALGLEIAKTGGELEQLPLLKQRQLEGQNELQQSQARLLDLQKRLGEAQQTSQRFEGLKQGLQRLESTLREHQQAKDFAEKVQKQAQAQYEEAQKAKAQTERLKADVERHQKAESTLAELEKRRQQRDLLVRNRETQKEAAAKLELALAQLTERLSGIEQAKTRLHILAPLIVEQESLQKALAALQKAQGQLDQLTKRLSALEQEIQGLEKSCTEQTERIAKLAALKPEVERLPSLEKRQKQLREKRQLAQEVQSQISYKKTQKTEIETEIQALTKGLQDFQQVEERSKQAAELDKQLQALRGELAEARAEYKRLDAYASTLSHGRCPLLEMPCLSVPDQTHFDGIRQDLLSRGQALAQQEKQLGEKLKDAQQADQTLAVLKANQTRKTELEAKLQAESQALLQLEDRAKAENLDATHLQKDLQALEQELRRLSELAKQYSLLAELEARYTKDQASLEDKKRQRLEDQKVREALWETPETLVKKAQQLQALGDPLGEAITLRKQAELEPSLIAEKAKQSAEFTTLTGKLAELEKALEQYAGDETKLQAAQQERAQTRESYQSHLKLMPLIESLPQREKAAQEAEEGLRGAIALFNQTTQALEKAKLAYDPLAHEAHQSVLEEYRDGVSKLVFQVKVFQDQQQALETQIQALEQVQKALSEKLKEVERWEAREKFLEFSRTSLKSAGPHITEAYLASISQQANQLYRAITDNPHVDLLWQKDYEIALVENGHSRPFSSLSGGEQMAAALSVRLALIREISSLDLAFFDEPTTNLDEDRRRNLATQISRVRDFSQLFVISHDDTFEDATDHVIRLPLDEDDSLEIQ